MCAVKIVFHFSRRFSIFSTILYFRQYILTKRLLVNYSKQDPPVTGKLQFEICLIKALIKSLIKQFKYRNYVLK